MHPKGLLMYVIEPLFAELEPQYRTRIYFGLGDNGQVKIGMTGRQNGRRGGEMHFTELCSIPGDRPVEDWHHAKYAAERISRTEWFILSDRLLVDLMVMCVQQGRHKSAERLKGIMLTRLRQVAA
jgi:hypothetical protein